MSAGKWERTVDAGAVPEPDPNVTPPNEKNVFGPMSTAIERGLWLGLDGAALDQVTVAPWVRIGGKWYKLTDQTVKAGELTMSTVPVPDGLQFALVVSAVVGTPTRLFAGTIGPEA